MSPAATPVTSLAVVAATWKELSAGLAPLGFPAPPFADLGPKAEVGRVLEWSLDGRPLLLCATGVGLVNAALSLGGLLARHTLSGVLNIGVAGSYDLTALPLGAVCVASREVWPEYGLETDQGTSKGIDARALRFPVHPGPGPEVWQAIDLDPDLAAANMGLVLPPDLPRATALSVSTVTGSAASAQALRERHHAGVENMEGFALALGCLRAGTDFLELRAVSNQVGSRASQDWDLPAALSALGRALSRIFQLSRQGKKG